MISFYSFYYDAGWTSTHYIKIGSMIWPRLACLIYEPQYNEGNV